MEENNHIVQHNSQQDVEESSSINLQLIYKTLVLNWQWFVLSVIVCLGLAFCYLRYATPIYQASVKLLIKDDDSQTSRSGKSALMTSSTLGIMTNSAGIDNEMEILKSARLAEQTCRDLKLYVTYKKEGRIKDNIIYGKEQILTLYILRNSSSQYSLKSNIRMADTTLRASTRTYRTTTKAPSR